MGTAKAVSSALTTLTQTANIQGMSSQGPAGITARKGEPHRWMEDQKDLGLGVRLWNRRRLRAHLRAQPLREAICEKCVLPQLSLVLCHHLTISFWIYQGELDVGKMFSTLRKDFQGQLTYFQVIQCHESSHEGQATWFPSCLRKHKMIFSEITPFSFKASVYIS